MDDARLDARPVAQWEFMSVAIMLFASHGDDAEAYAQQKLNAALSDGNAGERVTWGEVVKLLPQARLMAEGNR